MKHRCTILGMAGGLPLFARLSHAYVAFTVACDNGLERCVPHRTTGHGGTPGAPWLVSSSLWFRFLRHVPVDDVISVRDLKSRAALPPNEFRMWLTRFESWWGYLSVDGVSPTVQATRGGRFALTRWPILLLETEQQWRDRFGPALFEVLTKVVATREGKEPLPPCLNTLNYGLYTAPDRHPDRLPAASSGDTSLPALLARVLYAFALDYERETLLALALTANILRVVPPHGIAVREIHRSSGIGSEAVTNATKLLLKGGAVEPCVSAEFRGRALRRTDLGAEADALFRQAIQTIEVRWRKQMGGSVFDQLCRALPQEDELLRWMQPQPGNWRASVPAPQHLPYFPMILHRGGFPDGS